MKPFTIINSGQQFSKESFWPPVKLRSELKYISGFTPFDKIINRETGQPNPEPETRLELIFRQEWLELVLLMPACNYSAGITTKNITSITKYTALNTPVLPTSGILISIANIASPSKPVNTGATMALTHAEPNAKEQTILIGLPDSGKRMASAFFQKCFPNAFSGVL